MGRDPERCSLLSGHAALIRVLEALMERDSTDTAKQEEPRNCRGHVNQTATSQPLGCVQNILRGPKNSPVQLSLLHPKVQLCFILRLPPVPPGSLLSYHTGGLMQQKSRQAVWKDAQKE